MDTELQRRVDRTWSLLANGTTEEQCSPLYEKTFKCNYYAKEGSCTIVCIDESKVPSYNIDTVRYLNLSQSRSLELLIEIVSGDYVIRAEGDRYPVYAFDGNKRVTVTKFFYKEEALAVQLWTLKKGLKHVLSGHSIVKSEPIPVIRIDGGCVDFYSNDSFGLSTYTIHPVEKYVVLPPLYSYLVGVAPISIMERRKVCSLQSHKKVIKWATAAMLTHVYRNKIRNDFVYGTLTMTVCDSSCKDIYIYGVQK